MHRCYYVFRTALLLLLLPKKNESKKTTTTTTPTTPPPTTTTRTATRTATDSRRLHLVEGGHDVLLRDGHAAAHAGEAPALGERLQHHQVGVLGHQGRVAGQVAEIRVRLFVAARAGVQADIYAGRQRGA